MPTTRPEPPTASPHVPDKAGTRRWGLLFSLALLTLGSVVYANGMDAPFLFDGIIHIQHNPAIRDITNLSRLFGSGYQETRPLFMLGLALCYHIAGTDVFVYHLVNLLLHLGAVLVIYQLTWELRRDLTRIRPEQREVLRWFPEFTALFFLLHPLQTESVTYMNARSGLQMAFFGLLSCWLFLRGQRASSPSTRWTWGLGSIGALLLSLLSKEPAVLFPLAMIAWLALFQRDQRPRWRDRWLPLWPHLLCVGVVPLMYLLVTNPHPPNPYAQAPLLHHLWTSLALAGYFLGLSFGPLQQNFDYDFPIYTSPLAPTVALSLLLLLLLAVWAWRKRHTAPLVAFGLGWFLLFLAPTNSLVLRDFAAERYLYTSLLGSAWLLAWLTCQALARWPQAPLRYVIQGWVALYLVSLGVGTVMRNAVLRKPQALWEHTVQRSPRKGRPHLNLAVILLQKGLKKRGKYHLYKAAELSPRTAEIQMNVGVFEERQGRYVAAAKRFQRAYQLSPKDRYLDAAARMYRREGARHYRHKRYQKAADAFRHAIKLRHTHPGGHFNLAMTRLKQGQRKAAIRQLKKLVKLAPYHMQGHALLQQLTSSKSAPKKPRPRPARSPNDAARLLFVSLRPKKPPRISPQQALRRCQTPPPGAPKGTRPTPAAQIKCMLKLRYGKYRRAHKLVLTLYQKAGWVIGLQPAQTMDGGWRGKLYLVPQLPVGRYRHHLRWLNASVDDYKHFFGRLKTHTRRPIRYRWRGLGVQFFRSVGRATPSAMALGLDLYYNVKGSLLRSARGTRETLFHELFHINDELLGQWSDKALKPLYDAILKRCTRRGKVNNRCLKPYAPHPTIIRRLGIYYAFHKGGGVKEYAAELAIRYYREHRAVLRKQRKYKPFKCRTKENANAWKLLADTFFGGVDLTPACR